MNIHICSAEFVAIGNFSVFDALSECGIGHVIYKWFSTTNKSQRMHFPSYFGFNVCEN